MRALHIRVTEQEIGPHASTDLSVWLFFQIAAGHIALPILIGTFLFAKSVKKVQALVVLCVAWVISAICSTLLFYVGQHTGPEPNRGLCITQASLLGAVPPMLGTATVILTYHVLKTYDDPDMGVDLHPKTRRTVMVNIFLVVIPFVVFGLFVGIGVGIALRHPERVTRTRKYFYCSLDWPAFSDAVSVIALLLCLAALAVLAHVAIISANYWHLLRRGGHLTNESIRFTIRVLAFTCFLFASFLVNLISIWAPIGVLPDMLSASVGMALFVIFVTQYQIFNAWSFWRRRPHEITIHPAAPAAHDSLDLLRARYDSQGHQSALPTLSSTYTLDAGRSSNALSVKEQYEAKQLERERAGVQIIGRPDEAFGRAPPQYSPPRRERKRDTISTWGF